nr:MAG TPA: hypothetical protein [Caudoviricetes sp.]
MIEKKVEVVKDQMNLETLNKNLISENETLKNKMAKLNEKLAEKTSQNQAILKNSGRTKKALAALEESGIKDAEQVGYKLARFKEQNTALAQANADLVASQEAMEAKYAEVKQELEKAQEQIEKDNKAWEEINERLKTITMNREHEHEQFIKMDKDLKELMATKDKKNKEIKELKDSNNNFVNQLGELEAAYEKACQRTEFDVSLWKRIKFVFTKSIA